MGSYHQACINAKPGVSTLFFCRFAQPLTRVLQGNSAGMWRTDYSRRDVKKLEADAAREIASGNDLKQLMVDYKRLRARKVAVRTKFTFRLQNWRCFRMPSCAMLGETLYDLRLKKLKMTRINDAAMCTWESLFHEHFVWSCIPSVS